MGDRAKLPVEWKAGWRYVTGWAAGLFLSEVLVFWKLSGFDGPEYGLFLVGIAVVPFFVWVAAWIDRRFLNRQRDGVVATFTAAGLLSGLPAFLLIYCFRLMFTIHRR